MPVPDSSKASATRTSPVVEQRLEERIARVEAGLPVIEIDGEPPLRVSLHEWMDALEIPGLSVAVIDDHRIAWARGYGVKRTGGSDSVAVGTLFQAASISKPVTALAVLHYVERGKFALDADINEYLRSWRLADNDFTAQKKVTLRQLLAHTGGVTPGGFPGYGVGSPLPDLVEILNGEAPATNAPATVVVAPGTVVRYSGLGYAIIQLALIDQLGRPFPKILHETVLKPLGMESSTFEQLLPKALTVRAANGHDVSGNSLEGNWYIHPEMAAAGLWTTPHDLATLVIEVAKSKRGVSNRILSPAMTRQMLTQEKDEMGLGFVIKPDDEHGYFAHSGGNQGYRCHMRAYADAGKGIVIMTNSDNGGLLFFPLMESVAREYGWPSFRTRQVPRDVALRVREKIQGIEVVVGPAILAEYVGKYELASKMIFDVALEDGQLLIQLADQPRFPVYPESDTTFYYKVVRAQISFTRDESGQVSGLILHQNGQDQMAKKIE